MRGIPLIDMCGTADVIHSIENACHDIGFMYVAGHGISSEVISQIRSTVVDYFELPSDLKIEDQISQENYRGYIPQGFFSPNSGGTAADSYEGYKLHQEIEVADPVCAACDLYGPNKWPRRPKHFKRNVLNYWRECDRVALELLGAMAEILGTAKDQFLQLFDKPLTNMTLLHYPPQDDESTRFGIHPHKDTDALTILAPEAVGGLFIRHRDDQEWIKADPPADALIVNIGNLLELWSGGYFVSTPHKVINSSGKHRYSFPYFAVPRFDTVVEPIRTPLADFDRSKVHVGDVSKDVWRTNWPGVMPDNPMHDLGTLEN